MLITARTHPRELDHRNGDGVDVTLLWDPHTDRVSVAVIDEHTGEVLIFGVDRNEALAAFHHPYAYASSPWAGRSRSDRPAGAAARGA